MCCGRCIEVYNICIRPKRKQEPQHKNICIRPKRKQEPQHKNICIRPKTKQEPQHKNICIRPKTKQEPQHKNICIRPKTKQNTTTQTSEIAGTLDGGTSPRPSGATALSVCVLQTKAFFLQRFTHAITGLLTSLKGFVLFSFILILFLPPSIPFSG